MRWISLVVLLWSMVSVGCSETEDDNGCVENLDLECSPLYEPIFSEIHQQTLVPSCALAGGSCHSSQGAKGGLVLEEEQGAYEALVDNADRVKPGDPACSGLVVRLESSSNSFVMPPGSPLSEAERCVLRQWIAAGANP